jgi:hypothetical protein
MRRVDDLVTGERELAKQAVEVALRLRAKVELWLFDQEHDAGDAARAAGLERGDQ